MFAEKVKLFGRWRPRVGKKKSFQERRSFQRMKTGESLIPVSKDMHRKKKKIGFFRTSISLAFRIFISLYFLQAAGIMAAAF